MIALIFVLLTGSPAEEPAPVNPADTSDAQFDDVIITGSRVEQLLWDFAGEASLLSGELILQERMPRSFPTALAQEPGVSVQKTAYGQASPFIRGFTGYHTVALVDGIRLNNSVMRSGPNQYWTTVDALGLERLELVKGTASVLYGSDAIGGVAQALFRERQEFDQPYDFDSMVHYRYASAEDSHSFRIATEGNVGSNFGYVIGATLRDFGDLSAGRHTGLLEETGYEETHGDGKLTFHLSDNSRFVVAYQIGRLYDVPRSHRTIFSKSYRGTTIGSELQRELDQSRDLAYARLYVENDNPIFDQARLTVSYHVQDEKRDRIRSDGRRDLQGFTARTWGFDLQNSKDTSIGEWTYGVDFYRDQVQSFRTDFNADGSFNRERIQGPVGDDADYDLLGVYAQDRIGLTDDVDLGIGLRYTHAAANADEVEDPVTGDIIDIDDDWSSMVGDVRLSYYPKESVHTYASVAQGFRAPNLSDLTRFDTARSGEIETPSPDLDPEDFLTFEVGAKFNAEPWRLESSYFYTLIDDMIVRTPTGRTVDGDAEVTKLNGGDGLMHGIELGAAYDLDQDWTVFGDLTWTAGRIETFKSSTTEKDDEPVDRIPPLISHVGARYEPEGRSFFLEGLVTIAAEQDHLSPRDESDTQRIPDGGTPGYVVYTVRGGIHLSERLYLSSAIENIADQDYRIHGSGQNEPGTNVVVGLTLRF